MVKPIPVGNGQADALEDGASETCPSCLERRCHSHSEAEAEAEDEECPGEGHCHSEEEAEDEEGGVPFDTSGGRGAGGREGRGGARRSLRIREEEDTGGS